MICFLCNVTDLHCLSSLVTHFKVYHNLKPNSTYECKEDTCTQYFQNLNSFKRHINRKHISKHIPDTLTILESHEHESNPNNTGDAEDLCVERSGCNSLQNHNLNLDNIAKSFQRSWVFFLVELHNNNNFTRSNVTAIQNAVISNILQPLSSIIDSCTGSVTDPTSKSILQNISLLCSNVFEYSGTEYRLKDCLFKNDLICNINEFTIYNDIRLLHHNGETTYNEKLFKGVVLPLKFQFRKYFEKENVFENTINRLNYLSQQSNHFEHFVQGKLWKAKVSMYANKIVVPYFLYLDDFEINNPLGSHATVQSVCGVYYSFPVLENCSKLDNIFVAAFIKSTDLKQYGNDLSLQCLINELNSLEVDGVLINTKSGTVHVHFILGLILGDNLGLNCILEFSRSISANYYCRFCKINKKDAQKQTEESVQLLRNIQNYKDDVALNDFRTTGIYKDSILNTIESFHVTKNYAVDIMHDLFEGVCHYDMCEVLNYYINEVNIFTLDTLNSRKQQFNYGSYEIKNLSPSIKYTHIKNKRLKMTAREMMNFIHFFPLVVGDLVPEDDPVWEFFLNLLKICDLVLSYKLVNESILYLKNLIKVHNSQYISLFSTTLKPKHHILEHYATVIEFSGPPDHYWSMRFEAKHKQMKIYAHAITSRKNITLTLLRKYELKFAHFLMSPLPNELLLNSNNMFKSTNHSIICKLISNITETDFECYSEVIFKGTMYKQNDVLTRFTDELCIFQVCEIIVLKDKNSIKILCKKIRVIGYFFNTV